MDRDSSGDPIARTDQAQAQLAEWAQILGFFRQELQRHGFSATAAERLCGTWLGEGLFQNPYDFEPLEDDADLE